MGDGNSFPLVCAVVTGNFGGQSIVLCMCSGRYIDIYFIMKITFHYTSYSIFLSINLLVHFYAELSVLKEK